MPDFKTRLVDLQHKYGCKTAIKGMGQGTRSDGKVVRVAIEKTPGWLREVSTKNDFEAIRSDSGAPIAEGDYWQEQAQKNPRQFTPLFDACINTEAVEKLTRYFVKMQSQTNYRLDDAYNVFKERWGNEADDTAEQQRKGVLFVSNPDKKAFGNSHELFKLINEEQNEMTAQAASSEIKSFKVDSVGTVTNTENSPVTVRSQGLTRQ